MTISEQDFGRLLQQLDDSRKNQTEILQDLRTIFRRIEDDSKELTKLEGVFRAHIETSEIRIAEYNKQLTNHEERIFDAEAKVGGLNDKISTEREARSSFQASIESSVATKDKAFRTAVMAISLLATILGILNLFMRFVGGQ